MIFDVTKKRLMEKLNYSVPPALQFRYKTRVYKQTNLDEKALSKLSTKVSFNTIVKIHLSLVPSA